MGRMGDSNVLITGTPRSGTTLVCHLLNKLDDTVALSEPMKTGNLVKLPSLAAVPSAVHRFCDSQRESLLTRKRAISKNVDGVLADNTFANEAGMRKGISSKGEIRVDKPLSPNFTLILKHPAIFTASLEELVKHFPVYTIMRNPLAVMASWNSIESLLRKGRVPVAEKLDPVLHDTLQRLRNPIDRQIHILDWYHSRWHRYLQPENFIRYEDIVSSKGAALSVVHPAAGQFDEPLTSRNIGDAYDREMTLRLGERLLASDGSHWRSYSKESVQRLLETMTVTNIA